MFDPDAFGEAMGDLVREAMIPLQKRIDELERQAKEAERQGDLIEAAVARHFAGMPLAKDGADGKDADMEAIAAQIKKQVEAAVAEIPAPKDGRDGEDGKDGEPGRDGADGKDGANGRDGVGGRPGEDGADGRDGADGKDGAPGADGKSFTIEDADALLQEKMARWELDFERRAVATLEKAIDRMPKPQDGKDGSNGIDGLGFDDMQAEYDGARGVTLKFARGEQMKTVSMTIPVVIDRGVYKQGEQYEAGDGVTWGGSYWIAQGETKAKPDGPDSGWRLAVKKGRDGKDGRDGIDKTAPVKVRE